MNTPSQRTLVPREHGAYGQLIMPLLTALAIGRPGLSALALTAAVVLGFVAHEPLLVAAGQRGPRAREQEGARARRRLAWLGALAICCGALGLATAPAPARWAALLPALLASTVALLVVKRLEKTTAGEILVATALSSCGLAVSLAGGAPFRWAMTAWVTWVMAFASATLAVQVVLVRARSKGERNPGPPAAAATVAIVALALWLSARAALPWAAPLALAPPAAISLALSLFHVSPRHLRRIGWFMVGASVLTMVLLVVGLRTG